MFLSLPSLNVDASGNGFAFSGLAGPSGSSGQPLAAWRHVNGQNNEILRFSADSAFGPNLGAGWRFNYAGTPGSGYLNLTVLDSPALLIDAPVPSPANLSNSAIVVHLPGAGNAPCMVSRDTGNLGPGIAGLSFSTAFQGYFPFAHDNRIYVNAIATGSANREGIWRVCDGAPRPLAVGGLSGSLGPNTGILDATFLQIRGNPQSLGNGIAFLAQFRNGVNAELSTGIFQNQGNLNTRLAQSNDTGNLGPNFGLSRFASLDPLQTSIAGAGPFLAFEAIANEPSNTSVPGLWRTGPQGNPEPVALVGVSGVYAPADGQTFQRFDRWSLFANGDIVAECVVNGGPHGLYRFAIGPAPELILRVGQSIAVATSAGPAQATVNSFSVFGGDTSQSASSHPGGFDSWAARDGSLLVSASVAVGASNANVLMLSSVSNLDAVFANGFE